MINYKTIPVIFSFFLCFLLQSYTAQALDYRVNGTHISLREGSLEVELDAKDLSTHFRDRSQSMSWTSISGPVLQEEISQIHPTQASIFYPDLQLQVTLGLKKRKDEQKYRLIVTMTSQQPQSLKWPIIPFELQETSLIWPHNEGHYIPLTDEIWRKYLLDREWDTLENLYMPFWGIQRGEKMVTYVVENPFHNQITFQEVQEQGNQSQEQGNQSQEQEQINLHFEHTFPNNRDLTIPLIFHIYLDQKVSPIQPAKHFRSFLQEKQTLVTLKEKMKTSPHIKNLIGAPHAYIWGGSVISVPDVRRVGWIRITKALVKQARSSGPSLGKQIQKLVSREDWNNIREMSKLKVPYDYLQRGVAEALSKALQSPQFYHSKIWPEDSLPLAFQRNLQKKHQIKGQTKEEWVQLNSHLFYTAFSSWLTSPSTWGNGVSTKMIDSLEKKGLPRFLLTLDGWEQIDIRPQVASYAQQKGYLLGAYDSFNSIHDPKTAGTDHSWPTAQFNQKLYDEGGIVRKNGKKLWGFKRVGFRLSPVAAKPYVEERVKKNFAQVAYSYYFVDADAFGEYYDDYHPQHQVAQSEGAQARVDRIRWIFENFRVPVGSEGGNYLFAPYLSVAEGVFSPVIWGDPEMKDRKSKFFVGRYYPPEQPEVFFSQVPLKEKYVHLHVDPRFRLPLYEAVFHDSVVTSGHWSFSSLKFTNASQIMALSEILYQIPPLYHLNLATLNKRERQIKSQSEVFEKTHRYSYQYPLENFEHLTFDRDVQKTSFGKLEVVANFKDQPFTYQNTTSFEEVAIPAKSLWINFQDDKKSWIYTPPIGRK